MSADADEPNEATEPEAAAEPAPTEPTREPTREPPARLTISVSRHGLVVVAVGLVVLAALALAVLQWRRAEFAIDDRNDRDAAAQVAGEFTQALLTYNSANPASTVEALRDLATEESRERIDQSLNPIVPDPAEGEVVLTSEVDGVYVNDIDGDRAESVTSASSSFTAQGQTLPVVFYVKLDLRREGGSWKIDKVLDIVGPLLRAPDGSIPGVTTTTAVPGG